MDELSVLHCVRWFYVSLVNGCRARFYEKCPVSGGRRNGKNLDCEIKGLNRLAVHFLSFLFALCLFSLTPLLYLLSLLFWHLIYFPFVLPFSRLVSDEGIRTFVEIFLPAYCVAVFLREKANQTHRITAFHTTLCFRENLL